MYQINKNWKPSKCQVLDAFIFRVDTQADVSEGIEIQRNHIKQKQVKLNWKSVLLQPFVLAVGTSWSEIEQTCIVVDRVLYTFTTIIEAVEVCFQLFHSLHAEYPLESHNTWEFIQQGVYGIYTEFDWNNQATAELGEQLCLKLDRPQATNRTQKSVK